MPPRRAARRLKRVATPPSAHAKGPSEAELVDTFHLFAVPRHTVPRIFTEDDDEYYNHQNSDGDEDPDEAVLKVADVRRALAAVDIGRPPADFFEPGERCVGLEHFVMLANTLAEAGDGDGGSDDGGDDAEDHAYQQEEQADDDQGGGGFIVEDNDEDEDMAGGFERPKASRSSNARGKSAGTKQAKSAGGTAAKRKRSRVAVDEEKQRKEIDHAFSLFTHGSSSSLITVADLRRVARELRDDVDDATLRRMLGEATGDERAAGVGRDEFEAVMRRAGVFA